MAILPLEKIRIFAPQHEAEDLMNILHTAGCTEIISTTPEAARLERPIDQKALQAHDEFARIEMARIFFSQHHQAGFFRTAFEGGRSYTSPSELLGLSKNTNVDDIITLVEGYQGTLAELGRREKKIEDDIKTYTVWESFPLPLSSIKETALTLTYPLGGAEHSISRTLLALEQSQGALLSITTISPSFVLVTFLKSAQITVEEIISTNGVEVTRVPASDKTAAAELHALNHEHHQLITKRAELMHEIQNSAPIHLPLLKKVSDLKRWEVERLEMTASLATTDRLVVVTAWSPKHQVKAISQELEKNIPIHALEIINLQEEETVPTGLTNNPWIVPFESVTNLYGAPYYKDLDPTPVLALFFFVYFGFCLSDAGYGLALMLITALILWRFHLDSGTKQLITLLFYGGVGTVIAGILFGGYFGVSPVVLAESFPALDFLIGWQLYDPVNDPLPVFYLALVLGFIHIVFGIFLNLYRKIGLGETRAALFDDAPWLFMFTITGLYLANQAGYLHGNIAIVFNSYANLLFGSAVFFIVATAGRAQKNIFGKVIGGVLGLYGVVGYFADILSYSRLMALGLATGALAFSINSIALFVGGDSLGIGTIMMVIVLIFGHTLNIVISLMGTFINSARLQFVEFFSKFTTASGRPFTPFCKEPRHVIILPDPPSSS